MRHLHWATLVAALVVGTATAAERGNKLPADAQAILDKAEQFELFSLDPDRRHADAKDKDSFQGWKVLARTTVKDAEVRKKVLAALTKGMADSDGTVANCFNPRHGLRATHDGKTLDLVICFECKRIEVVVDGKKSGVRTTASPQSVLGDVLMAAGAKKGGE